MTTLICTCNQTIPLDAKALGDVLGEAIAPPANSLCRRDAPLFQKACQTAEPLTVACTQEAALFTELAEQTEGARSLDERPIRFVNLRETGGWGREARQSTPKMAALLAAARLPDPDPVPAYTYNSEGRLLIIGPLEEAERHATLLADTLRPTIMGTDGAVSQSRQFPVLMGQMARLQGWLGAFKLEWSVVNPIDLDLCTRCNACVTACPEGAIGLDYQVDLARCASHRDCVKACEAVGAIRFDRAPQQHDASFDLVLDLRPTPAFTQQAHPQGYVHLPPGTPPLDVLKAVMALKELVGEFDKPRFFQYRQKLCAHSRNNKVGCSACIDVCSASAVRSDVARQQIVVEPALCVGCGACTTVCPSGALSYATLPAPDLGKRLQTMLKTYHRAGGKQAAILFHNAESGAALLGELGRMASLDKSVRGVPARVLPVELWHVASTGIEQWLTAIAHGASNVWVLTTEDDAPQYRDALREQMAVAQAILSGLGLGDGHFRLIECRDARDLPQLDAALAAKAANTVAKPASFAVQADKRTTLDLALDFLQEDAAARATLPTAKAVALPVGSPLGSIKVNADSCTLCLSCVSTCPEGALLDNKQQPELRLIERNCVQCGLCASTCPEKAIELVPRLTLGSDRRQAVVINQAQPYQCIRCGKPFGTLKGIEAMLTRLSGHAMFQGEAADRLKMCGDCRVVDIYSQPGESKITDL